MLNLSSLIVDLSFSSDWKLHCFAGAKLNALGTPTVGEICKSAVGMGYPALSLSLASPAKSGAVVYPRHLPRLPPLDM